MKRNCKKRGSDKKRKTSRFFQRKNSRKHRSSGARKTQRGGMIMTSTFSPSNYPNGQNYYPVNSYNNDPTNPVVITSSRLLPNMSGGVRQSKQGRSKKMRGGFVPLLSNDSLNNAFTNFGTFNGASLGADIINGTPVLPNSNMIIHPSAYTYNEYRSPLV